MTTESLNFYEAKAIYDRYLESRHETPTFEQNPDDYEDVRDLYGNGANVCPTCGIPYDRPGYRRFDVPISEKKLFGRAFACPEHGR